MKKIILAAVTATIAIVAIALKSDLACQYSPFDISWINSCETTQNAEKQMDDDKAEDVKAEDVKTENVEPEAKEPVVTIDPNEAFIPTFDIARVEPDGSTLVAGRGAPKSKIILLNDGENIGETLSNGSGEWVIIVDEPISAASATLSLVGFLPDGSPIESKASLTIALRDDEPEEADVKDTVSESVKIAETAQVETIASEAIVDQVKEVADKAETVAKNTVETVADKADDVAEAVADTTTDVASTTTAIVENVADKATDVVSAASDVVENVADKVADVTTEAVADVAETVLKTQTDTPVVPENIVDNKVAEKTETPLVVLTEEGKPSKILQGADVGSKNNEMTFNSLDYNTQGEIIFSGDAKPNEIVRVYVNNEFVGEAKSDANGRWALDDGYIMQAGRTSLRFDQVDVDGKVIARRVTNMTMPTLNQPAVDATPAADATANTADAATSDEVAKSKGGRAVIIWGDNLWNISRKIYGKGELYTTIFKANKSQIRDPNLIYPGQVFLLPDNIEVE